MKCILNIDKIHNVFIFFYYIITTLNLLILILFLYPKVSFLSTIIKKNIYFVFKFIYLTYIGLYISSS